MGVRSFVSLAARSPASATVPWEKVDGDERQNRAEK
jgi:hypothetical protein